MLYLSIALFALGAATRLLWLQYHRPRGTPSHVKRGIAVMALALAALGAIECVLFSDILTLVRSFPFFVVHMFFAIPTLIMLIALAVSGVILYRLRSREEHESLISVCTLIHHTAKYFPYAWAATLLTGLMFLLASLSS